VSSFRQWPRVFVMRRILIPMAIYQCKMLFNNWSPSSFNLRRMFV